MGMASVFYDVLNHIVIDSSINPNSTSERDCAAKHLSNANKNDQILYDRGHTTMAMAAQKRIEKKIQHQQLNYQINFAQAVSKMKHRIVYLIRQAHSDITLFIKRTILYISQTIEAVRDGRSVPRRLKNLKNGIHFPAYKNTL